MSDAFTARATTRTDVREQIEKLPLVKNANGQYTHDAISRFLDEYERLITSTFNPSGGDNGMAGLLVKASDLSKVKSTGVATAKGILAFAKQCAEAESKKQGKTVEPEITDFAVAQDIADRRNTNVQATIGAKEGATEALVAKVGTHITDPVLRSVDGNYYKGVDEYELADVVEAARAGADHPSITAILDQLLAVLRYRFNFQRKCSENVELLRTNAGKLAAYGIDVPESHIAIIILANIVHATRSDNSSFANDFRHALRSIQRKYNYDHKHDAMSIKFIMTELASADRVRNLRDAPVPGEANVATDDASVSPDASIPGTVDGQLTYLFQLMSGLHLIPLSTDDATVEAANAATSDSESSTDKARSCSRNRKNKDKDKDKKKGKRDKSRDRRKDEDKKDDKKAWRDNPCPHCKKWRRNRQHPNVSPSQCSWNQSYKGYRPDWICKEMEIEYKPRHYFWSDDEDD